MTYETKMTKGRNGHRAETDFVIQTGLKDNMGRDCVRLMRISTSKGSYGGVSSFAQVLLKSEVSETTLFPDDYMKHFNKSNPPRVTEKVIREAHNTGLAHALEHLAAAKAQYGIV